jgi:hypothetical protein
VDCHNVFWAEAAKRAAVRNGMPCDPTARYRVCNGPFGDSNCADTLSQLPRLFQYSWGQDARSRVSRLVGNRDL